MTLKENAITLVDQRDARKFWPGMQIVFTSRRPRWWVRLWRWVTRWKPPPSMVWTVTAVDSQSSKITCAGDDQ